jgi:hypothetical protein
MNRLTGPDECEQMATCRILGSEKVGVRNEYPASANRLRSSFHFDFELINNEPAVATHRPATMGSGRSAGSGAQVAHIGNAGRLPGPALGPRPGDTDWSGC